MNKILLNREEAIQILIDVRDNLNVIELDMDNYLKAGKISKNFNLGMPYSHYKKAMEKPSCNTSCCLVGSMPLVAPKFTKSWKYNFSHFSMHICETLCKDIDDVQALWDFLFSSFWNNDKTFATERLNMVINDSKFFRLTRCLSLDVKNLKECRKLDIIDLKE